MKKVGYVVVAAVCLMLMTGCGGSSGSGSSLAAQIIGTYLGILQSPLGTTSNYKIVVTKIDDETVQIAPASGGIASSTFTATLTSSMQGDFEVITIHASDIIENNGTVVPGIGRLSYTYFRGGDDDSNIEVFVGSKI